MPQTAPARTDVDGPAAGEPPDSNQVWAVDFCFDETADGRRLKLANVVDEFTARHWSCVWGLSCDAEQLIGVIKEVAAIRGAPEHPRMDNGHEMIAWGLREWCRIGGTRSTYVEPGAPWESPSWLQRPGPRRAAQRRGLRGPPRNSDRRGGLARRVQHLPSPLGPERSTPDLYAHLSGVIAR